MPMFVVGVATTALVVIPWLTNLVAKPLATAFGGSLVLIGLVVAFVTNRLESRRGRYPIFPYLHRPEHPIVLLRRGRRLAPAAVLAFLPNDPPKTAGRHCAGRVIIQGPPGRVRVQGTDASTP